MTTTCSIGEAIAGVAPTSRRSRIAATLALNFMVLSPRCTVPSIGSLVCSPPLLAVLHDEVFGIRADRARFRRVGRCGRGGGLRRTWSPLGAILGVRHPGQAENLAPR